MNFARSFISRTRIIIALILLVFCVVCTGCLSFTTASHLHPQWAYPIDRPGWFSGAFSQNHPPVHERAPNPEK